VSEPVTVIVTRTAKAGKVQEFEEWMQGIIGAAKDFSGFMGADVIRPDNASLEYVIVFRFDSYARLEKWQRSPERQVWIEKGRVVVEGEPKVEVRTGLEFWFTPANNRASAGPAPRYKMALVIIPVISVLLLTLVPSIQQATEGLPVLLRTVAGVVIMVLLMTYVIMPAITRAIAPWLYKKSLA
jgi:antibiotic biosynthesis monooxygenase (ABM) superfamily enzyme